MWSLFYPWMTFLLLFLASGCLVFRRWKTGSTLLLLFLLINCLSKCLPVNFHFFSEINKIRQREIKVMTYNVHGSSNNFSSKVPQILRNILGQSPDFIFINEYYQYCTDTLRCGLIQVGYHLLIDSKDGDVCFCKLPSKATLIRIETETPIHLIESTVEVGDTSIVIIGCHLASNNYDAENQYHTPQCINTISQFADYLNNINSASNLRASQAKELIQKTHYPSIIMGDFNDVSGSTCLDVIEAAGYKDAWWEGGLGYGATIHSPLPFRIDHIMYSNKVALTDIEVIRSGALSDHDAIVAKFIVK